MKDAIDIPWLRPLSEGAGPRYLQIADLIDDAIHSGKLGAGDPVPSQRWLAAKLGVDLTTVTRAYTEARNRGLIASFSGRGSFVVGPADPAQSGRIDLSMNTPPQPADHSMAEHIRKGLQEVLAHQPIDTLSRYPSEGSRRCAIQAAQAWLRPALGDLDSAHLMLCEGAQAALFGILLTEARRGETVLCEALTYPGFLQAARRLGLRIVALEGDEDGVLPDAIERAHSAFDARWLYLNPTLHNPTTRTMPESRRKDVANTVQRLGMTLIEDDPYRYLLGDAPPPIAALNGGIGTYYLASLSKCLSPALRTAFVLPPRGQDSSSLQDGLLAASMGGSPLLTALAEHWLRSGAARHLVQEIQREARARQSLARAWLPAGAQAHPTGLHVWLTLPDHWNQHLFAHALDGAGISVACAEAFSAEAGAVDHAVRLSLGGANEHAALARALRTIADLLPKNIRRGSHGIV